MSGIGKSRNQAPGPVTVTVVNSDPDAGEVVARVLEAAGHDVARVFEQVPTSTAVTADPPALVVLDLGGGASNPGLQILQQLRDDQNPAVKGVRAVMIGTQPGAEALAWKAGADGYLARPMRAEELVQVVADALARPDRERAGHRAEARKAALSS